MAIIENIDDEKFLFKGEEVRYERGMHDPALISIILSVLIALQEMANSLGRANAIPRSSIDDIQRNLEQALKEVKTISGPPRKVT